jgi:hypothetical protein
MSKLVTLDEIEEYEREQRRAHAEGRAPVLRDPHDVFVDNLGNTESHLEELSAADQTAANNALAKRNRDALNADKKQMKVIRDNTNRLPDGQGSVLPYSAPDPKRYSGPKNADERRAIADKVEDDYHHNRRFDDSFSDSNIPNTDDNGQVLGDSVNVVLTRKMTTFSPDELVRENEANAVPVPERYKNENPPQVIQQSNPITGEPPTPEPGGFVEGYRTDGATDVEGAFVEAPTPKDVPHTAISVPFPAHVIGDETGTTREVSRDNASDVNSPGKAPSFPTTVPLTEGQVAQGAVKRPDHFDPPTDNDVSDISQSNVAATVANLPVDATGLRGDNKAHKAAVKALKDE